MLDKDCVSFFIDKLTDSRDHHKQAQECLGTLLGLVAVTVLTVQTVIVDGILSTIPYSQSSSSSVPVCR